MLADILKRLAEMFPRQDYQSRLENYISSRYPKSTADVEYFERQYYQRQQSGGYLWNEFYRQFGSILKPMGTCEPTDISNMDIINKLNLFDKIQRAEEKYGLKIAIWTIAIMIVYLVIAQWFNWSTFCKCFNAGNGMGGKFTPDVVLTASLDQKFCDTSDKMVLI